MLFDIMNISVLALLTFAFATNTSTQKTYDELDKLEETVDSLTEKCMEEQKLQNIPDYFSSEEEDQENIQCFVNCRQKKVGVGNNDGTLNLEEITKITDQFSNCNDLKEANDCDTAYKVYKCGRKVLEELNIMLKV